MSHQNTTYCFSFYTTSQQDHSPNNFRAHVAVTFLNSGLNSTVKTVMSALESMEFLPTTPLDTALVLILVFIHAFIIGSVIALTRWMRTAEHDCEFGLPTVIDRLLYHEEATALLAVPVDDDPSPAYMDTNSDEPPAYSDIVGIDLAVFVVETDDEEDDTL
ncbi:hypothetical protein CFE70_008832 [Pyrenophora teres f. teres 0-1]|uniref:Uncharacterized protein n=1 Tax=Pyrenophora teres f. teres (strain 0-1) TaxID=861557 RepID=E3RVN2_PYRTT|nr:hypothetical protein PTT_13249 [Pyrenophora teres f. teres 0-1]